MIIIHPYSPENFILANKNTLYQTPFLITQFLDFEVVTAHLLDGVRDSMSIFEDHATILLVGIVRKPHAAVVEKNVSRSTGSL